MDKIILAGKIVVGVVVAGVVICGAVGTIGFGWAAHQEQKQRDKANRNSNK